MTASLLGRLEWGGSIDSQGYRTWDITWLIETTSVDDGPAVVATCAGLPVVGSQWFMGNDIDGWAWCLPTMTIRQIPDSTPGLWTGLWTVKQQFSTQPTTRNTSDRMEDPLLEPWKIRGSFNRSQKEAKEDRNGNLLLTSSMEFIRGLMRDVGGATVTLSKNFASLPLASTTALRWHLNDGPMWGMARRCVKLAGFEFQQQKFGTFTYWNCGYTFEVAFEGFDERVVDQGTRVLVEGGTLGNLVDYRPTTDGSTVLLNGLGKRATSLGGVATAVPEVAPEANLFVIGIPTSF